MGGRTGFNADVTLGLKSAPRNCVFNNALLRRVQPSERTLGLKTLRGYRKIPRSHCDRGIS